MKRIIKLIIVLVIAFPIFLNATSYGDARDIANNYNSKFPTFKKYLRYEDAGLPYGYSGFKYGGFVSLNEFKITLNGKTNPAYSYLYDGISYWSYPNYAIDDTYETNYAASKSSYGTKVTEFVRSKTKVKGTGTYDNPWIFVDRYHVEVSSNGFGSVSVSTASRKVANSEGKQIEEVEEGENSIFNLSPDTGYVYQGNTCGTNVTVHNNILTIKNVTANINCSVTFKENEYVITLPLPYQVVTTKLLGQTTRTFTKKADPEQFFAQYNVGYFKDEEKKNRLSLVKPPFRKGWSFDGYFVAPSQDKATEANRLVYGYKYEDYKANNNLTTNFTTNYTLIKNGSFKQKTNDNIVFKIHQNQYTITYNSDGGSSNMNPKTANVIFESDLPDITTIPGKSGYVFDGYYTAPNGGKCTNCDVGLYYEPVYQSGTDKKVIGAKEVAVWQEDFNTTLYAKWKPCRVGHYCTGDNEEKPCPVGQYQDETGKSSCKPCEAGKYQDETGKTSCKCCPAGQFQNETGKSSCKLCGYGTHQPATCKTSCDNCPKATYQDEKGQANCKDCDVGQTSPEGSTKKDECHYPPIPQSDNTHETINTGGNAGGAFIIYGENGPIAGLSRDEAMQFIADNEARGNNRLVVQYSDGSSIKTVYSNSSDNRYGIQSSNTMDKYYNNYNDYKNAVDSAQSTAKNGSNNTIASYKIQSDSKPNNSGKKLDTSGAIQQKKDEAAAAARAAAAAAAAASASSGSWDYSGTYSTGTYVPSGRNGCFLAGTKVKTISGFVNIEDIKSNDIVLSYNVSKDKYEYNKVIKPLIHENSEEEIYVIEVNGEVIKTTSEHPFYIARKLSLTDDKNNFNKYETNDKGLWTKAKYLKEGYYLMDSNGIYYPITKITHYKYKGTVYNLNVENNHNYFVSESSILVHNLK